MQRKELKEELEKVSGGRFNKLQTDSDYGDRAKDNNPNNSMYKVGMWVELYNTAAHLTTKQLQIKDAKFEKVYDWWVYYFDYEGWFSANEIETGSGKWEPHD